MYGATIPEDAEAILSKQAKNQAPGALDEEAGGESQPPHKSYGRIIFAGLALLAFVLIAVAAGAARGQRQSLSRQPRRLWDVHSRHRGGFSL